MSASWAYDDLSKLSDAAPASFRIRMLQLGAHTNYSVVCGLDLGYRSSPSFGLRKEIGRSGPVIGRPV